MCRGDGNAKVGEKTQQRREDWFRVKTIRERESLNGAY